MKLVKSSILLLASFAACGILGIHSDARAQGPIPATNCVKVGTSGTLINAFDGSISNSHPNQQLTVSCPVPWGVGQGYDVAVATIEYVDSSPAAFTCTLRAENALSTIVSTATVASPSINDNTYRVMSNGSVAGTLTGGIHVVCSIPAVESGTGERSYLLGISVI